jgi:hypothetical protein
VKETYEGSELVLLVDMSKKRYERVKMLMVDMRVPNAVLYSTGDTGYKAS